MELNSTFLKKSNPLALHFCKQNPVNSSSPKEIKAKLQFP